MSPLLSWQEQERLAHLPFLHSTSSCALAQRSATPSHAAGHASPTFASTLQRGDWSLLQRPSHATSIHFPFVSQTASEEAEKHSERSVEEQVAPSIGAPGKGAGPHPITTTATRRSIRMPATRSNFASRVHWTGFQGR